MQGPTPPTKPTPPTPPALGGQSGSTQTAPKSDAVREKQAAAEANTQVKETPPKEAPAKTAVEKKNAPTQDAAAEKTVQGAPLANYQSETNSKTEQPANLNLPPQQNASGFFWLLPLVIALMCFVGYRFFGGNKKGKELPKQETKAPVAQNNAAADALQMIAALQKEKPEVQKRPQPETKKNQPEQEKSTKSTSTIDFLV